VIFKPYKGKSGSLFFLSKGRPRSPSCLHRHPILAIFSRLLARTHICISTLQLCTLVTIIPCTSSCRFAVIPKAPESNTCICPFTSSSLRAYLFVLLRVMKSGKKSKEESYDSDPMNSLSTLERMDYTSL
jgi:hypothetical protein